MTTLSLTIRHEPPTYADVMALPGQRHRNTSPDEKESMGSRHAAFAEIAAERGVSPQRMTLAWLLAKAPVVIPIPGASRPESIIDSAQAPELVVTPEEFARLDG
jgi:aryl-alcohol dehydrogenase-like predicted oxidoreductase